MQQHHWLVRSPGRRRRPRHLVRLAGGALAVLTGLLALSLVTLGVMALPAPVASTVFRGGAPGQALAAVPAGDLTLAALRSAVAASGGRASVAVIDLGGDGGRSLALDADASFTAASTYKLPILMATAQRVAAGSWSAGDRLCFAGADQEDGWFDDYQPGSCFSRQELAERTGTYSDNTAAHMLVDALGGGDEVNTYARALGTTESAFYDPNLTTARDLATLMAAEADGKAGGRAAQDWLYPMLTHTAYEDGIPAGVGTQATVVHKIGEIDQTVNDVALVTASTARYVVAITTDGLGGDAGWALVARLSAIVWGYETS